MPKSTSTIRSRVRPAATSSMRATARVSKRTATILRHSKITPGDESTQVFLNPRDMTASEWSRARRKISWFFGAKLRWIGATYLVLAAMLYLHANRDHPESVRANLILAAAGIFALTLVGGISAYRNLRGLRVRRLLPKRVRAATPFTLRYEVEKGGLILPSMMVQLKEREIDGLGNQEQPAFASSISARAQTWADSTCIMLRRGRAQIAGLELASSFPLGVAEARAYASCPQELLVYPRLVPLPESFLQIALHGTLGVDESESLASGSVEANSTREYQFGDPVRLIHWPTSARAGKPMLLETDHGSEKRLMIIMDGFSESRDRSDRAGLEQMICLSASIMHELFQRGVVVGLALCREEGVVLLSPNSSSRIYEAAMEHLATVGFSPRPLREWVTDHTYQLQRSANLLTLTLRDAEAAKRVNIAPGLNSRALSIREPRVQRMLLSRVGDEAVRGLI